MNCADARDIILSADHNALRERTDPVLRAHLEGCAECAAAASHVVGDVARLRAALIARGSRAVARPRRSPTKRVAMTLVPIALAAELAAFAFIGVRDNPNPLLEQKQAIDDSVTTMLSGVHTTIDTGEVVAMPKQATVKAAKQAATSKDSAQDAVDSTKRVNGPSEFVSAAEMAQLEVAPMSRAQRVAVISTSNPRITVVWLSKVDSL